MRIIFYKQYWSELYYNTKWGLNNLFTHFNVVWKSRPWDFNYSVLEMVKFKLELLYNCIENGDEEEVSRDKKVKDIKRCIELINNRLEDNYLDRVGGLNSSKYPFEFEPIENKPEYSTLKEFRSKQEIKEDKANISKSIKLDNQEWKELWLIIKDGSDGENDSRSWWY